MNIILEIAFVIACVVVVVVLDLWVGRRNTIGILISGGVVSFAIGLIFDFSVAFILGILCILCLLFIWEDHHREKRANGSGKKKKRFGRK